MTDIVLGIRLTADAQGFNGQLKISKAELDKFGDGAERMGGKVRESGETARRAADKHQRMGSILASAARHVAAYAAAYVSLQGVQRVLAGIVREASNAERISGRLDAVLRATGNAAGFTRQQLDDLANSLADKTLFDDDSIRQGIAVMATFRNVTGETFRDAIAVSGDLAELLGTDLQSAILQVGKALDDPVTGVTALRRAGVSFSASQRDMIQQMVETGRVAEAQAIVMKALKDQVGGTAEGANTGLAGAATNLGKAWDDMLEALGRTEAVGGTIQRVFRSITSGLKSIEAETKKTEADRLREQIAEVERSMMRSGEVPLPGRGNPVFEATRRAQERHLADLRQRLELLEEPERRLRQLEASRQRDIAARPAPPVELTPNQQGALDALRLQRSLIGRSGLEEEQVKALQGAGFKASVGPGGVSVQDFEKLDPVVQRAVERIKTYTAEIHKAGIAEKVRGDAAEQAARQDEERNAAIERGRALIKEYDAEALQIKKALNPQIAYNEQIARLKLLWSTGRITLEEYRRAAAEAFDELEEAQLSAAERQAELNDSFADGAKVAFQKWSREAGNSARQGAQLFRTAIGGMEDAMVDLYRTGKLSFQKLGDAFVEELIRMQFRAGASQIGKLLFGDGSGGGGSSGGGGDIIGGILRGLGGLGGGGGAGATPDFGFSSGAFFHGGGTVGVDPAPRRAVPAGTFRGAPRWHEGHLAPGEVAAILRRDESVLTPGQMRALGGGRSAEVNIQIVNTTGEKATATETRGPSGQRNIAVQVGEMMATDVRSGGPLGRAIERTFGASRQLEGR